MQQMRAEVSEHQGAEDQRRTLKKSRRFNLRRAEQGKLDPVLVDE